jgi:hypothetical protein
MNRTKRMIMKAIGSAFLFAAVVAPTAAAEPRSVADLDPQLVAAIQRADRAAMSPDDRPFSRGLVSSSGSVSPDDRSFNRGVSAPETAQSPSPDDRPFFRGLGTLPTRLPVVPLPQSPGFQWDDASIGALTTLSLMALLGAAAFAVRRQSRRVTTL